MNSGFRKIVLVLLAAASYVMASAQFNPDLDASKGRRRSGGNRDDLLWHPETANTQSRHAGNISLLTATRFGISERLELSTYLAFDYFQPNIAMKYRWAIIKKNWIVSSKINLGNAYTGLSYCKENKTNYVAEDAIIPVVGELGHELIVSRRFSRDQNCSNGSDYLILTASLGTYWGIEFKEGTVTQIPRHFLANRSMLLIDNNFLGSLKLWADWNMNSWMNLHGGLRLMRWTEKKSFASELQVEAELFITKSLSARAGGALSLANYKTIKHKCGVLPLVDITYYFGSSKGKEKNLFNPNGKLY